MGSSRVVFTGTLYIALVLSKEFLDVQANINFGFILKRVRDMIRTCSQMHRTNKYSQHSSIIWAILPNGWVFLYKVSGCGFKSHCSRLNIINTACFEHGVLDVQASIGSGFTLKRVRDMIRTYSQMHRTDKYSKPSSLIWAVWSNDWVFVYEVIGCCFRVPLQLLLASLTKCLSVPLASN